MDPVPRGWKDWALCAALVIAAGLVWYWRLIEPATIVGTGPALDANSASDLQLYSYGMWHRAPPRADSLWLWNPYQLAGHPFLATLLNGVLYPPAWLARLLPTPAALEASNLLHMAAAGIFTFWYARTIALGTAAALLAAISFMFSGFIGGEAAWFTPAVGSAIWLPLGMLAIEKLFATQRMLWSVPLAIAVGMPILSGWVQSWVYSLYLLGGYTALRLGLVLRERGQARQASRLALLAALGALAGVALAAAQLLPSLELMSLGPRRPDSLSVSRILALGPVTPAELLRQLTDGSPGYGRFAYVGLAALVLAPLACFVRIERFRALFLAAVALFSLGVVAASSSDWFEFYLYLPGGGLFRKPQRILYLFAFSMAVLSGIGFDSLRRESRLSDRARLSLLAGAAGLVVIVAQLAGTLQLRSALCLLLMVAAAGAIRCFGARGRALASIVLLSAVLGDLVGALRNPYMHPFHQTTGIDRAEAVFEYLRKHQGHYRSYLHDESYFRFSLMPKQGTLRGVYAVGDYEPLSTQRHKEFFAALEGDPERGAGRYTFTGRLVADPAKDSFLMLDLLSVRYIVGHRGTDFESKLRERGGWRRVMLSRKGGFVLYERNRPLPRAYFAGRGVAAASSEEAIERVSSTEFDPWREVVIEGEVPPLPMRGKALAGRIVSARLLSYEGERVVVGVEARGPGYLVLTDSYYPGWQATVDGEAVEIERANGLFRAVRVSGGKHRVVFEYRPASFRVGSAISLTSGAVLLAILISARRRASQAGLPRVP